MALLLSLVFVLAACTQEEPVQKSPIPEFDFDEPAAPRDGSASLSKDEIVPPGPFLSGPSERTVVATGPGWKLTAFANEKGKICTDAKVPDGGSGACGSLQPNPSLCEGRFLDCGGSVSPGRPFYLNGLVARGVSKVRVDLLDGRRITTNPVGQAAGFSVNFYFAVIDPCSLPVVVTALDGRNSVVERLETGFEDLRIGNSCS
ncbi:MAG: hypothetical protein WD276_02895 [Actinomycetota bacterium]